jgi:hypothetical protein
MNRKIFETEMVAEKDKGIGLKSTRQAPIIT